MSVFTTWRRAGMIALSAIVLAVAVGCSSDNGDSQPAATPVSSGAVSNNLTVVMLDNKYETPNYTVKANEPVTMAIQNKGAAIHNVHIMGVENSEGKQVMTKLLPGGQSENVTFTLTKTGTFDYICDVHPAEMKGKLTVQ